MSKHLALNVLRRKFVMNQAYLAFYGKNLILLPISQVMNVVL